MEEECPEVLLLKHNRRNLELALKDSISPILEKLNEYCLIKPDIYDKLKDSEVKVSSADKASFVISCLLDKVRIKASHLQTFISIISAPEVAKHYEDVIEILQPGNN